ncbi:MAG: hypothetical protein EBU23_11915, partial [Mycobacteriaceae bacterium]|nr:hypothetical protein [Mycobacteriaceae bacterium]
MLGLLTDQGGSDRPTCSLVVGSIPWIVVNTLFVPAVSGIGTSCGPRRLPEADCAASAIPTNAWSLRRRA